jgi:hypothetical protein
VIVPPEAIVGTASPVAEEETGLVTVIAVELLVVLAATVKVAVATIPFGIVLLLRL